MADIDRQQYGASFGPTTGDRIRLADTDLFIEIEEDRCGGGDEAVFGGGKTIRESMGQSRATRAEGTPDLVITGAVVLDHRGIIKGGGYLETAHYLQLNSNVINRQGGTSIVGEQVSHPGRKVEMHGMTALLLACDDRNEVGTVWYAG